MTGKNIRVLIVDDEKHVLDLIKARCGKYSVATESDSLRAAERIKKEKFDILIVDCQMPRMTGIQLFEKIKSVYEGHHYVGVFCTASGTTHLFKDEFAHDLFTFFVEKPIEHKQLEMVMEKSVAYLHQVKKI